MKPAARTGLRAFALATVAGMALGGVAIAQKPSAQGAAPQPALPTAKPPPLGAPAPLAQPTRPAPAPRAQAPATPPAASPVIPANEAAAITRLRGMIGPRTQLSYASAETLDSAGEQVRLTGVVLEQRGKRATADELLINGLREDGVAEAVMRGFATTEGRQTVRISQVRIAGLTVPRNPAGGPPQPDQVRLEQLRVEGVEVSGRETGGLRLATVENWLPGQPARVAFEGLEVNGIGAGFVDTVRLARFALAGVDIGATLAALMEEKQPPSLVGRASIDLEGLDLLAGGQPVGRLGEVRIAADVQRTDGSGDGTVAFRGIRVEPVPMLADWMTRFGYQAIEGEITAQTSYDAQSGRIEIRDLSVMGRDAGTISLALVMDGVTQQRAQAGDFANMRLISAGLRYADASLFGRFIAMQARQSRTPEPQLREQMAAMAGGALAQQGATGLDPIRDAVQRFIRGQAQTVEIRMNPPQPIKFSDVQGAPPNPAAAQRMFGISAEAR